MAKHPLREYQRDIIQQIENAISQGYRRIMLQLPTGAGKTRCFVELATRHRSKPYIGNIPNCLIVAHRKELIDQAVNALTVEIGNKWEIGIIKSKVDANPYRAIQVASIQSLIRRDFPKAGLVIIDEAHHATANSYQTIIAHYGESIILGVTATPARTDGKGFRDSFEILIKGPTVKGLIAQNYLCPYKLYAYTKQKINTTSVKIQAGDYILNQLADAVMDSQVRADLVQTWEKHAFEKRTVVFAVNVELSKEYAAIYKASGYKAEHVDGGTPEHERTAILDRFKRGETKILCNCNIVTEGFDLPEMECVQIVRPTKSLIFWLQMVGRSLRTSKGKSHAIILDHTDNYQRLSLPDSDHNWSLSGVKTVSFIRYFSGINNNEYERRRRELQHIEGELVEIYSSLQESENIDMVKITIDNVEYEVTRSLANVIFNKLDRLDTVEKLLIEKEEELLADNQANIYAIRDLQEELDKLYNESVKKEQILSATRHCADEYKKSIDEIQEEINQLRESIAQKQEELNIEISRANKNEKALKSANNNLTKLRETSKSREADFNEAIKEIENKQQMLKELEKQLANREETIANMLESIENFLEEQIESRLNTIGQAHDLLTAYNMSVEDADINTRMDAVAIMKATIITLNKKIDLSNRSDEYVIDTFNTYCEIVEEKIAFEKKYNTSGLD